ncbi:MAG: MFS transporter [Thermaerobacter sp.]|nr:MFS transporter [Thermaerobacter sp.]
MLGRDRDLRWLPWALLGALGWLFVYADRAVLSPLLRDFGRLFHVGPAALGLLSTAFFLTYTAVQIPAGRLADRISPRLLLGIGYVGFGVFVALTALSSGYYGVLAFSALAGLFQGVYYPTQFAVTARRIPPHMLPLANAVITSGMGAGIALGYLVATVLGQGAWQTPVWVLGVLTIGVGVVLYVATPKDVRRPGATAAPAPAAPAARAARGGGRRFALLLALNFCSLYAFFFLLAWLPYVLAGILPWHGLALGAAAAWPTIVALPATILWSMRGPQGAPRLRRMRLLLLVAGISLSLLGVAQSSPILLLMLLTLYGITGKLVLDPLILSEVTASLGEESYGQAFGMLNFVGMMASVVAPTLSGYLIEHFGGFPAAAAVAAVLVLAGLAITMWLRPAEA